MVQTFWCFQRDSVLFFVNINISSWRRVLQPFWLRTYAEPALLSPSGSNGVTFHCFLCFKHTIKLMCILHNVSFTALWAPRSAIHRTMLKSWMRLALVAQRAMSGNNTYTKCIWFHYNVFSIEYFLRKLQYPKLSSMHCVYEYEERE